MVLDNRGHIDRGNPPVFHDDPTVDYRVVRLLRRAEHGGRDWVVQCAGVINRVQHVSQQLTCSAVACMLEEAPGIRGADRR